MCISITGNLLRNKMYKMYIIKCIKCRLGTSLLAVMAGFLDVSIVFGVRYLRIILALFSICRSLSYFLVITLCSTLCGGTGLIIMNAIYALPNLRF